MSGAEKKGRWPTWATIGVVFFLGSRYALDERAQRWETLACIAAVALYRLWERIADIFDEESGLQAGEARFDTRNPDEE